MPITDAGYVRKFFRERLNGMIQRFRDLLPDGKDWDINDDGDLGVEYGVLALDDDDLDRAQEALFLSLSPRSAPEGKALSEVGSFRAPEAYFPAQAAKGFLIATGDVGEEVEVGTLLAVDNGVNLVVLGTVKISESGVAAVPIQADTTGPVGNHSPNTLELTEGSINFTNPPMRASAKINPPGDVVYAELNYEEEESYYTFPTAKIPLPASTQELKLTIKNPSATERLLGLLLKVTDDTGTPISQSETFKQVVAAESEMEWHFIGEGWDLSEVDDVRIYPVNVSPDGDPIEIKLVDTGTGWTISEVEQNQSLALEVICEVSGRIEGGRNVENHYEYRDRFMRSLDRAGGDRPASIVSKLAASPFILDYRVYPNWTLRDESAYGGLPEKSTRVVVLATGTNREIGELLAWGAGTQNWVGKRTVIVPDPDDEDQIFEVHFDHVVKRYMEIRYLLALNSPISGKDQIRRRAIRYVGGDLEQFYPGIRIGQKPSHALITGLLDRIEGITTARVRVRWKGDTEWVKCDDLPIEKDQTAVVDWDDITFGRFNDAS